MIRSSPSLPWRLSPSPCMPRPARNSGLKRNCKRVFSWVVASIETEPPLPPSPPEGPPRGTNFSRRNAVTPLPPSPPFTSILARSKNCIWSVVYGRSDYWLELTTDYGLSRRVYADELPFASLFFVLNKAGNEREKCVI